ncbi:MAG: DNA alkylation response protein [Deltaproteobacteria bacterium]|nr:DNA alkylation response protein [Deltaproteobacteria bacterium]MBU51141.1 DNA alkylation response protein [Deltaproteobacteria bacterium]
MSHRPMSKLKTHEVTNQVPFLEDINLFETDIPLQEALEREGAGWAKDRVSSFGGVLGSAEVMEWGADANNYPPELQTFDRYGHRIDEVKFHPAYHNMMRLGMEHEVHSIAWNAKQKGGHVAHTALEYLLSQVEASVCCPLTMTYAVVPALRNQPDLADIVEPFLRKTEYDARCIPMADKTAATMGMAMTEKQGGSDVRANSTKAHSIGGNGEFELVGHKWFCSAPMSDAFLTLAYTEKGLSCFYVPRWRPDGTRNPFYIQRLKDKLGNKANASSEIEYNGTWARLVGEEGRGVRTIIEMVHHTRLDCTLATGGLMRRALTEAMHHANHRSAFKKKLIDQPLMKNVLADLAIETEAATTLAMRIARAYDDSAEDASAGSFARIAVAVGKYWTNKRVPVMVHEAMECLGGAGYVEESIMPRLYREAPLNGIWEGSGNVICLDVLRAMHREPESVGLFLAEVEKGRGSQTQLDAAIDNLKSELSNTDQLEFRARMIVEKMALALQGSLLVQHAPTYVSDTFCATRLGGTWGRAFGTMPVNVDVDSILQRAQPLR